MEREIENIIIQYKSQVLLKTLLQLRQCLPFISRQNKNKFFDEIPHFSFNEFDPDSFVSLQVFQFEWKSYPISQN